VPISESGVSVCKRSGQLSDRIFVYAQFGENNFNNISDRKLGFFVHDAYGEYAVLKDKLSVGAGLSGVERFVPLLQSVSWFHSGS
jgi:hypothetical protein